MTKPSPGHMHHVVERDLLLCFIDFVLYVEDYLMYYWPFKRGSFIVVRYFLLNVSLQMLFLNNYVS